MIPFLQFFLQRLIFNKGVVICNRKYNSMHIFIATKRPNLIRLISTGGANATCNGTSQVAHRPRSTKTYPITKHEYQIPWVEMPRFQMAIILGLFGLCACFNLNETSLEIYTFMRCTCCHKKHSSTSLSDYPELVIYCTGRNIYNNFSAFRCDSNMKFIFYKILMHVIKELS